jgi:hypothetical protein
MPRHPEVGAAKERKLAKKEGARERRQRVREACCERANGSCEAGRWGAPFGPIGCCAGALQMDHFHGRKNAESVEDCWMLCMAHHGLKTANHPRRSWWLGAFRSHALFHGYAEQIAKVDRALALEEAQHPAAARAERERSGQ